MSHSGNAKSYNYRSLMMFCFLFGTSWIMSTLFSNKLYAQGNLLITPKRVVFEGNKRSEELNLANTGNDSATYVISFVQIRMKDDGSFEQITDIDSNQKISSNNLRFFPRSVTLGPNEAQSVKVQLVKGTELATGEYRSHLYFRAVQSDKALGEEDKKKDSSISVKLTPIFGITMPILIRVGEPNANISLSDLSVNLENESEPIFKMRFNRSGEMSSYGDLTINYISPQGKTTRVGLVKGLAVYTPNIKREFQLKLDNTQNINYRTGKLKVTYTDQSGKAKKLAEEELVLL
jgi:hypothetical protein